MSALYGEWKIKFNEILERGNKAGYKTEEDELYDQLVFIGEGNEIDALNHDLGYAYQMLHYWANYKGERV